MVDGFIQAGFIGLDGEGFANNVGAVARLTVDAVDVGTAPTLSPTAAAATPRTIATDSPCAPMITAPSPTAKEVQQQWEVDALARVGEHVEAILDGTFNLIALNALKLKKDLKIVFERDEPLYGLLLYKFTQHCSQQVSKSSFLTSVRAIAVRCDFHVDGLVSVATDIWNEAKQASPTGEPNKRVNFRAGHKRSFGEATSE